jgi:predicted porin
LNPSIKFHAGIGNFDSSDGTYQGTSKQFGATYTMGMLDFMAQQASVDDTSANNVDRKLTGLGANYNLSKNTRIYYRNENVKFANSIAAFTTDSGSQQKRAAIGLSMKF